MYGVMRVEFQMMAEIVPGSGQVREELARQMPRRHIRVS